MAKIVFRPTCNSCLKILDNVIVDMWVEDLTLHCGQDDSITGVTKNYHFEPAKCPYCGELFNGLVFPNGKLPIKDEDLMKA